MKEEFYVARLKKRAPNGEALYARLGRQTGMGGEINDLPNILNAERFSGPSGIMTTLGGHYRGYDPVKVTATYEIGEVGTYPPESEVW